MTDNPALISPDLDAAINALINYAQGFASTCMDTPDMERRAVALAGQVRATAVLEEAIQASQSSVRAATILEVCDAIERDISKWAHDSRDKRESCEQVVMDTIRALLGSSGEGGTPV